MKEKPLILITNDDGVRAKGINELIASLRDLGNIIVVAPDGPRSGFSAAITSTIPISITKISSETGLDIYTCSGTPTDCVKLAMNEILDKKPDLIFSGINHGSNMAIAVHYSGTLGAAMEGCVFGVPSVGVSLTDHEQDADFRESARIARIVAKKILKEGLPLGTYLNVNIPNVNPIKGMKICRQARGKWTGEYQKMQTPTGKDVFWLTGNFVNYEPIHPENDTLALDNGYASIVACKLDVTDYEFMKQLEKWDFNA